MENKEVTGHSEAGGLRYLSAKEDTCNPCSGLPSTAPLDYDGNGDKD